MAWAEGLGDVAVVLAALILVTDQESDRGAGRLAFKNAGENFDRIRLAALRDVARGSRLATIELGLDVGLADFESRRTAINHAADRRTVRFAEGSNRE